MCVQSLRCCNIRKGEQKKWNILVGELTRQFGHMR